MKRKSALTLIEIMIVISLITLIMGVVGYNMKGVLDRGKKFRTEQAIERLKTIFEIAIAEGKTMEAIVSHPLDAVEEYGYASKPKELVKDGWNKDFRFTIKRGEIEIFSDELEAYNKKHK